MKKLLPVAIAVGLFSSGLVIGQAFGLRSISDIELAKPDQLGPMADQLANSYWDTVKQAKSAAQVSQVSDEAAFRMQYIQVKQNTEIIRLLKKIAGEK